MKVIKRNGNIVEFDKTKIENAIKRIKPASKPPFINKIVLSFVIFSFAKISDTRIIGTKLKLPIILLAALKVNGSTYSMPVFWATKESPDINAAIKSDILHKIYNLVFFILPFYVLRVTISQAFL